ncbi:major facilitator superfamily domain-containing protein [Cantharellus anzutake]|uniref:major facilitator superfamily domain-containing protein n=1 Tax=Cantharellus anzutake TaxID=1750568 RepID=UPI001906BA4E|nr:major facilitator superfamily domain-containing protein [Cantharellus anzutake]KAF8330847.1 major facilitator superfamily domain-containing protein [Cantharellus anzutake]
MAPSDPSVSSMNSNEDTECPSPSERTPLLSSTQHDIPQQTPLPWGPISVLLMLYAVAPLAFELIFPFVNQMLVELRVVDDPEKVGFYSGFIESAFSILSLITALPSSYAADHFGRKPVILLGMTGLAVSVVCFGMSRTFPMLVLSRCIGGALGGGSTAIKTMLGELTDRTNQNAAFSALSISYRMGQIIGLPLGGSLAHPERHFPSIFEGPGVWGNFWRSYPFVLPCLVGAAFAFVSVVLGTLRLKETLPSKSPKKLQDLEDSNDYSFEGTPAGVRSFTPHPPSPTLSEETLCSPGDETDTVAVSEFQSDVGGPDADSTTTRVPGTLKDEKQSSAPAKPRFLSVMTKEVMSLMISNMILCLVGEMMFGVYPIFAFTPVHSGGLGFSESDIGAYLALRAMLQMGFIFFFVPIQSIVNRTFRSIFRSTHFNPHTPLPLYQVGMVCWPLSVLRQAEGLNVKSGLSFNIFMFLFFCVWRAIHIMVNDASPSAEALAVINGAFQMGTLLPQACGPALATSLFALSVGDQVMGGQLIWVVLLTLSCAGAVHSFYLKDATTDWRANRTVEAGTGGSASCA